MTRERELLRFGDGFQAASQVVCALVTGSHSVLSGSLSTDVQMGFKVGDPHMKGKTRGVPKMNCHSGFHSDFSFKKWMSSKRNNLWYNVFSQLKQ